MQKLMSVLRIRVWTEELAWIRLRNLSAFAHQDMKATNVKQVTQVGLIFQNWALCFIWIIAQETQIWNLSRNVEAVRMYKVLMYFAVTYTLLYVA